MLRLIKKIKTKQKNPDSIIKSMSHAISDKAQYLTLREDMIHCSTAVQECVCALSIHIVIM